MLPLLRTKINIPPTSPKQIRRARLVERVAQGAQRALVLVVAPAGFGKTSLAAAWAQEAGMPVAWLSLQPADRPRARFLTYLIHALQRVAPQVGQTSLAMMQGGAPEGGLLALVNDLAEEPGELALVLDDYHSVDWPETAAVLQFLLEHRPAGFHLLVTSRAAPGLNLARLRALDQVTEIGPAELRFTAPEVSAFLETSLAQRLPPEALARLNQSMEGWAVGLQLAALALARQPEQWQTLAGQEHIFEYLAEEVLRRESPEVQAFLRVSALFDRFCAPLLEHVQPSGRAAELIAAVERANLFLVPLDAEASSGAGAGWYRYHALFTDFLRSQAPAGQAGQLYRAASTWCEANGLLDDAIHYAVHGEDYQRAAELLEDHYIDMVKRGEQAALAEWIASLPGDLREQRPRLWLALGWVSVIAFDSAQAAVYIARAEPLIPAGAEGDRLRAEAQALSVLNAIFAGDSAAAERIDTGSLSGQDDFLESLLHFNLGMHQVMNGQTARAVEAFSETLRLTADLNYPLVTIFALTQLGETRLLRGALGLAERTFQQAIRYTRETLGENTFLLGIPYISYAELLREQNRFAEARHYGEQGIAYSRLWQPMASMDGEISMARILAAEGRWDKAFIGLERAMQVAEGSTSVLDDTFLSVYFARLALQQGDTLRARQVIQAYELENAAQGGYYHLWEMIQLVLLRARLAELLGTGAGANAAAFAAEVDAVSTALAGLIEGAERRERVTPVIEGLVLRAYAERAAGRSNAAADCLSRALALGAQSGYARLFADEGRPLLRLLEELRPRLHAPRSYLERILGLLRGAASALPEPAPATAPEGLSPLTRREMEILEHMAAGRSNQEIAEACVLTLNTVKKHVANILSKLSAANRTQAVLLARKAGWIV